MLDGLVDHVICDPPYDERTHRHGVPTSAKDVGRRGTRPIDFAHLTDFSFVDDLLRVSRGWVVCFCAVEDMGKYRDAAGDRWVRAGMWNRLAGTAFARSDRPYQGAEGIAIMHADAPMVFPAGARRAVWDCTTAREDRAHPTQKPVDLMLDLVRDFTLSGQTILDPFAGSGTTGVAALRLGRRFIGCEKDPRYYVVARDRLAAEDRWQSLTHYRSGQMTLFGGVK